jgi:hypothetical protein
VISHELRGRRLNAIGNLRTDSPILAALNRISIDPKVPYHSIIPLIGGVMDTDGVVEYRSSHLEGTVSERIIDGTHFCQSKPSVTHELRRILLEHLKASEPLLASGDSTPSPHHDPEVRTASSADKSKATPSRDPLPASAAH